MKSTIKIMLVEDDKNLSLILKAFLTTKGYHTILCLNGNEALEHFNKERYDFMIVDIMIPGLDGFSLVKEVRKTNSEIPIVFLTAKSLQSDIKKGFDLGADDYIIKPFNMDELILRIEAINRRTKDCNCKHHIIKISSFTLDIIRHVLIRNGVERKLTSRELELLFLLCEHINRVVERSVALKRIWNQDNYFNARNMDVYIGKIRKILSEDPNVELQNIHGIGYKLIVKDCQNKVVE